MQITYNKLLNPLPNWRRCPKRIAKRHQPNQLLAGIRDSKLHMTEVRHKPKNRGYECNNENRKKTIQIEISAKAVLQDWAE